MIGVIVRECCIFTVILPWITYVRSVIDGWNVAPQEMLENCCGKNDYVQLLYQITADLSSKEMMLHC